MYCQFCGKRLSLLQRLSGHEFCSAGHAELYKQDQESMGLARLIEAKQQSRLQTPVTPPAPSRRKRGSGGDGPPLVERFVEQHLEVQNYPRPSFPPGNPILSMPEVVLPQPEAFLEELRVAGRGVAIPVALAVGMRLEATQCGTTEPFVPESRLSLPEPAGAVGCELQSLKPLEVAIPASEPECRPAGAAPLPVAMSLDKPWLPPAGPIGLLVVGAGGSVQVENSEPTPKLPTAEVLPAAFSDSAQLPVLTGGAPATALQVATALSPPAIAGAGGPGHAAWAAGEGGLVTRVRRGVEPIAESFGSSLIQPGAIEVPADHELRRAGRIHGESGQPLGCLQATTELVEEKAPQPSTIPPRPSLPAWPGQLAEAGTLTVGFRSRGDAHAGRPPAVRPNTAQRQALWLSLPEVDEPTVAAVLAMVEPTGTLTKAHEEFQQAPDATRKSPPASFELQEPRPQERTERPWAPNGEAGWVALPVDTAPGFQHLPASLVQGPIAPTALGAGIPDLGNGDFLASLRAAGGGLGRGALQCGWLPIPAGERNFTRPVGEEAEPVPFRSGVGYPESRNLEELKISPELSPAAPARDNATGEPVGRPVPPVAVAAAPVEIPVGRIFAAVPEPSHPFHGPLFADRTEPGEPAGPSTDAPAPLQTRLRSLGLDRAAPIDVSVHCSGSLEPFDRHVAPVIRDSGLSIDTRGSLERPARSGAPVWQRAFGPGFQGWSQYSPGVKWLLMSIPLLAALVWHSVNRTAPEIPPAGPANPVEVAEAIEEEEFVPVVEREPPAAGAIPEELDIAAGPEADEEMTLAERWQVFRQNIMNRAAISLADDFRAGLGNWEGEGNWAQSWSYDDAGFVIPGALAIYRPSRHLVDYRFEFAGQIERGGISWIVRASDPDNYAAGRLVITRPGPMPEGAVIRYAVVDGKRGRVDRTPLPFQMRNGKMYRVRVDVRGARFTTYVDEALVEFYDEPRLKSGGVGFFRSRGEQARLRWISLTHQYDILGRLCALIAPYQLDRQPRNWKQ